MVQLADWRSRRPTRMDYSQQAAHAAHEAAAEAAAEAGPVGVFGPSWRFGDHYT